MLYFDRKYKLQANRVKWTVILFLNNFRHLLNTQKNLLFLGIFCLVLIPPFILYKQYIPTTPESHLYPEQDHNWQGAWARFFKKTKWVCQYHCRLKRQAFFFKLWFPTRMHFLVRLSGAWCLFSALTYFSLLATNCWRFQRGHGSTFQLWHQRI